MFRILRTNFPVPRVYVLLQVIVALVCGYLTVYSLTDSDIFWHLAAGREIVSRRALLYTDPFSYTVPGARWIDVHWFFQVLVYSVQRIGGLRLLLILKWGMVSAAVFLLFSVFRKNRAVLVVWLMVPVAVYLQRYLVPMRPIIATLVFIAAEIALLERYCCTGRRRFLLIVGVVQILWVNMQGLFALGPVIALAYGFGEWTDWYFRRRKSPSGSSGTTSESRKYLYLLVFAPTLLLLSLVNPYGWRTLLFSLRLFWRITPSQSNLYSKTIDENMPLTAMVGTPYMLYVVVVAGVLLFFLLSVVYRRNGVRTGHCLLAGAGLLLAWMAQRNGILCTLFVLPGLLWNFSVDTTLQGRVWSRAGRLSVVVTTGFALVALVNHSRMLLSWPHILSPFSYPTETAALLRRAPSGGNLFNADRYGGYLLWKRYPQWKVSGDTRLTMRPDTFYREYRGLIEHPETFDGYAARWNINHVVLPVAPLSLYLPLAAALYRNPRWRLRFTDGAEVYFCRGSRCSTTVDLNRLATVDSLVDRLRQRYADAPTVQNEAVVWLGRWCLAAGATKGARRVLSMSTGGDGKLLLAATEEQAGRVDTAEHILRTVCREEPRNTQARFVLATLLLRCGKRMEGIRELEILLKKDPFNRRARNILYKLSQNSGR